MPLQTKLELAAAWPKIRCRIRSGLSKFILQDGFPVEANPVPAIPHPVFQAPPKETKIWRYMDLARFVALLEREALFLARIGVLAANDPYEGRYSDTQFSFARDPLVADLSLEPWPDHFPQGLDEYGRKRFLANFATTMIDSGERFAQDCTFVNCWHMNSSESDAMWRLYSLQGQGIAIQSTYDRLERSLHKDPKQLFIGQVTYANYDNHAIDMSNGFNVVMNKRISFAHEQELRVAHVDGSFYQKLTLPSGKYASADLDILIDRILVSPAAPEWLTDTVCALVKRYGFAPSLVRQSPLYAARPAPKSS